MASKYKYNQRMIEENKVSDEAVSKMDTKYDELHTLLNASYCCEDNETIKALGREVERVEFELQELWNFPIDSNYHRYWLDLKGCCCPKDNLDPIYFGQGRIINNCPIHSKGY